MLSRRPELEELSWTGLSSKKIQQLNSNSYSRMILREAGRMLIRQRRENAPLIAAFKAQQKAQKRR